MKKRDGNRGAWFFGASVGALALIAWLASCVVRGEPRLLDQSQRLIDASFWSQDFGAYFWENDHTILTFRPEGKSVRAVSVDVAARMETPRTELTRDIASGGNGVRDWRLSRDGQRLLWCNFGTRWNVTDLSGKRIKTWKHAAFGFLPLWLADSRHWLGTGSGNSAIHFGSVGNYFGVYDISGPNRNLEATPGPCNWPVGITSNNHVVSLQWTGPGPDGNGSMDWYEYSLESKPAAGPHGRAIMPRAAAGLNEAELSPDGGRIACLVQYIYLSPVEQFLSQGLHFPIHPHQKVGLWVVNRDHGQASLVGSEEGPAPFGMLWTPDGKRLSYIQNGTLYSVAAPRP